MKKKSIFLLGIIVLLPVFAQEYGVRGYFLKKQSHLEFLDRFECAVATGTTNAIMKVLMESDAYTPVVNGAVTFYDGKVELLARTDQKGFFKFEREPWGEYEPLGCYEVWGKTKFNDREVTVHKNQFPYEKIVRLKINTQNYLTVVGIVVDANGSPIKNLHVKARFENKYERSGDRVDETWNFIKTNDAGEFIVEGVPMPNFRSVAVAVSNGCLSRLDSLVLTVEKKGYATVTERVLPISQYVLADVRKFFILWEKASKIFQMHMKSEKEGFPKMEEAKGTVYPKSEKNTIYVKIVMKKE